MNKYLRLFLILLCLAIILFSGWKLLGIYSVYQQGNDAYDSLSHLAVTPVQQPSKQPQDPTRETKPGIEGETAPITVDFQELWKTGPDIVAWLYCPDTPINYPVLLARDNDYYLNRLPDGTYNANGSLFLDYRCAGDFSDLNSIIYGHHMRSGAMFAILDDYSLPGFFEEHPVMYLLTPEADYKVVLFAGYDTPDDTALTYSFPQTPEDQEPMLRYALGRSQFDSGLTLEPGTRIITLSTCIYIYENARYIVQGYLQPLTRAQQIETATSTD